jgi:hypothetical protein
MVRYHGTVRVCLGALEIKGCSFSTGRWAVRPPALNAGSQLVTLNAPTEIRRVQVISYTITILNPSDSKLKLDP